VSEIIIAEFDALIEVVDPVTVIGGDLIIKDALVGDVIEWGPIKVVNHEAAPPFKFFYNLTWKGAVPREEIDVAVLVDGEYYEPVTVIELAPGAITEAMVKITVNAKPSGPVTMKMKVNDAKDFDV